MEAIALIVDLRVPYRASIRSGDEDAVESWSRGPTIRPQFKPTAF